MIREPPSCQPLAPESRRTRQSCVGLVEAAGERMLRPPERCERAITLPQGHSRPRAPSFESESEIRREPKLEIRSRRPRRRYSVTGADVLPLGLLAAVVEDRLALDVQLDGAVDAGHGPDEHVRSIVVGRHPSMRARALFL